MPRRPIDSATVYVAAGLISGAGALFFNVMPVFVGAVAGAFEVDASQLGDLVAVFNVGFTGAAVSAVAWIRRLRWKVVSGTAVALATAILCAMSLARDFPVLVALTGALGIAMGSLYALILAVLAESSQPDRAFGIKLGLETLPGAALLFALPVIVVPRWGFNGVLVVMAATTALLGLATYFLPENATVRASSSPARARSQAGTSRGRSALALASSLSFFTGIAASWAFLELLADAKGIASGSVGVVLGSGFVASGLGGFAAAAISRRYGRIPPMAAIILLNWLALWSLAGASLAAYAFGACAFLFTVNFALAYTFGLTAEVDQHGGFVVLSAAALSTGAIVGPAIGGRIVEAGGFGGLLAFSAACSLVSLAAYVLVVARMQESLSSARQFPGVVDEGRTRSPAPADDGPPDQRLQPGAGHGE